MGVGTRYTQGYQLSSWRLDGISEASWTVKGRSSPAIHPVVTGVLAAGSGHAAVDTTEPQRGY